MEGLWDLEVNDNEEEKYSTYHVLRTECQHHCKATASPTDSPTRKYFTRRKSPTVLLIAEAGARR